MPTGRASSFRITTWTRSRRCSLPRECWVDRSCTPGTSVRASARRTRSRATRPTCWCRLCFCSGGRPRILPRLMRRTRSASGPRATTAVRPDSTSLARASDSRRPKSRRAPRSSSSTPATLVLTAYNRINAGTVRGDPPRGLRLSFPLRLDLTDRARQEWGDFESRPRFAIKHTSGHDQAGVPTRRATARRRA